MLYLKRGRVSDRRFNHKQLKIGTRHEREHTNNWRLAKQIAKAHLYEDPYYYKKLRKAGL
jgi:hypothetical protein